MRSCSNSACTCGEGIKSPQRRQSRELFRGIDSRQGLFRSRAHCDVVGEIDPLHCAAAVDVKFSGTRDITIMRTRFWMKNVVAPNDFGVGIRQKRKGKVHLPRVRTVRFLRIDADRNNFHAARSEFRKTILKTPQLGVTKRSPMSTIKN